MKNILVIGSANADLTIHADRMPLLGETIEGYDFAVNSGGKGANQAVAIAKLGGNVKFLGAIGNDSNGEMILTDLIKSGVKFSGYKCDDISTGTASITVINGDNFIILNSGANNTVTPELIDEYSSLICESDILIMQLEIPVESVICAAKIAKEKGITVVLNPAPCKELPDDFFKSVDIIVPNEHEAYLLTGIKIETDDDCRKAVYSLLSKGVKQTIITLGGKGCAYNVGSDVFFRNAEKTNVVDTTSAGDTFIGALCCGVAEGMDFKECIDFASKASAITVSRKGASVSIPTRDEIK